MGEESCVSRNLDKQNTRDGKERVSNWQAGSFLHCGPLPLFMSNKSENMKKLLLVGRSALFHTLKEVYADFYAFESLAVLVGRVTGRLRVFRGSRFFHQTCIFLGDHPFFSETAQFRKIQVWSKTKLHHRESEKHPGSVPICTARHPQVSRSA